MATQIQLFRRFLSDSNLIKLASTFCTCTILRSDKTKIDEIIGQTGEVVAVNPIDQQRSKLSYLEERKFNDDLIPHIQENLSYLGGVPQEHVVERLVRIAKVQKTATQSGTDNTRAWILQFDNRQRWENNLMGWVSTGDPLSNLQIRFNTADEAIDYCERYRYPYYVVKGKTFVPRRKSYANIFSWNKRTRSSTK